MLAATLLLTALAAIPPPLPLDEEAPQPTDGPAADAAADEEAEPGLLETHFPTDFDEPLHPLVDENIWAFFVGAVLPFPLGPVLLPLIVIDGLEKDFLAEALITYLLHMVPPIVAAPFAGILAALGLYAGLFGVVGGFYAALFSVFASQQNPSAAGACLAIPLGLLCFAGAALVTDVLFAVAVTTNAYWCTPVAIANSASRTLYRAEAEGKRKRSLLELPALPALAAASPGSMAY